MARMVPPSTSVPVDVPRTTRSGSVPVGDASRRSRRQQSQQPANTAPEPETSNNEEVVPAKKLRKGNPNNHPNGKCRELWVAKNGEPNLNLSDQLAAIIEEGAQRVTSGVEQLQSYAEAASSNPQQIDPQLHDAFSAPEVERAASLQQIDILKTLAPQVLDALPFLAENATIVLRYLEDLVTTDGQGIINADIPSLLVELYEGTSRAALMFRKRINTLQQTQAIFLPTTFDVQPRYLQPSTIFQALFNANQFKDIPTQQLGARDIIYVANLANAVKDLLFLQPSDPNVLPILQEVDNEFPHQFLAIFSDDNNAIPGSSMLSPQAFDFGLSLRTQLVARTWMADHDKEGFDPVDAISLYFYFVDGMHKMWQVPNWQSDHFHQMLDGQLNALRSMVTSDGKVDFAELEQRFPWPQLQHDLCSWVMARFRELTQILESKGGVGLVLAQLRNDIVQQQRGTQLPIQMSNQSQSVPTFDRKTLKKGGAKALKKAAKRVSGKGLMSLPDATQSGPHPGYQDAIGATSLYPQLHAGEQAYGTEQRRQGIFDRQDTAQRLQFDHDDSQPAEGNFNSIRISDPSVPNSSAFNVTQDAGLPTQDEDAFQPDNRVNIEESQAELARQRAMNRNNWAIGTLSVTPDIGFQAAAAFKRTADMGQDMLQDGDHAAKRARMGVGEFVPEDMEGGPDMSQSRYMPPSSNYETVNSLAKRAVALHNKNTKGPQQRKAWSLHETNALADYISQYGISYTLIKSKDKELVPPEGLLWQRDQVALKDKARNMKFDYLK